MAANSIWGEECFAREEGSISRWEVSLCLSAGGSGEGFPSALTGGENAGPAPKLAQAWGMVQMRTLPG